MSDTTAKMTTIRERLRQIVHAVVRKGGIDIFVGSMLTRVAALLGSIVLVRVLTQEQYGVLSFVENRYSYAYLLAGLGLNNAVFRYLILAKSEEAKKGVFNYVLGAGSLINVLLTLVAVVAYAPFASDGGFSEATTLLPIMLCALPLQYAFETCSYSLRALFRNRLYAVTAFLAISLVWASKVVGANVADLNGVVASWPVSYFVMAAMLIYHFYRNEFAGVRAVSPNKKLRKEMLFYSLQYMVTNGLWVLFSQNDILLIGLLLDDPVLVAGYKVAFALPATLSILSTSIGIFVGPYFVKHERDRDWVWQNYKRVVIANVAIVAAASLGFAVLSKPMISLVYGEQYTRFAPLMNALLISSLLNNGLRYPTANLLAAMGRIRVNMAVSATGIVLQLLIDWLLIPKLGIYGAAASSIVVYGAMALAVMLAFHRLYKPDKTLRNGVKEQ